jgi:hypothetical protein
VGTSYPSLRPNLWVAGKKISGKNISAKDFFVGEKNHWSNMSNIPEQRLPDRLARRRLMPQWVCLSLVVLFVLSAFPLLAQDEPERQNKALFMDDPARAAVAATAVVTVHDPASALGILLVGKGTSLWDDDAIGLPDSRPSPDKAPVLDPDLLAVVQDRKPSLPEEASAQDYVLLEAQKTPLAAFAKSSRKDITFAHLWEETDKYRGQVVHIAGRLKRLRKFDASEFAAQRGLKVIYEGWIFGDEYFSNPYCVLFTELPAGVQIGEKVEYRVAFDGYFFKLYRYKAGDSWRDAPLLIGRSLIPREEVSAPSVEETGAVSGLLLPAFLTVVVATALLGIGLTLWFRRGDRRVQARLSQARLSGFVEPGGQDFSPLHEEEQPPSPDSRLNFTRSGNGHSNDGGSGSG